MTEFLELKFEFIACQNYLRVFVFDENTVYRRPGGEIRYLRITNQRSVNDRPNTGTKRQDKYVANSSYGFIMEWQYSEIILQFVLFQKSALNEYFYQGFPVSE